MGVPQTPLELKEFTGGPNDDYNSARPNQYQKAENIVLNREGNPMSRPGSVMYDSAHGQLTSGNHRVSALINFNKDQDLFAISGPHIHRYNSGWSEILGPSSGNGLPISDFNTHVSFAEWKKHLLIATSELDYPAKLYKDGSGNWQVRTAGLPNIANTANYVSATELANAISLANDLRTKLLAHVADTAVHPVADSASAALVTSGAATTLPTLLTLAGQLLQAYDNHYRDSVLSVSFFHGRLDPTVTVSNPVVYPYTPKLNSVMAPTTLVQASSLLNDLRKNYSFHEGDVDVHLGVGLHVITAAKVGPLTSGPSILQSLQPLYDLANRLKTQFLLHRADGMTKYTTIGSTNGSKVLTGFGSTAAINANDYVFGPFPTPYLARVVSKTGTTVTVDINANATGSNTIGIGDGTQSHAYPDTSSTSNVTAADATTPATLRDLVFALRYAYSNHLNPDIALVNHFLALDSNVLLDDGFLEVSDDPDLYGGFQEAMIDGIRTALNELRTVYNAHQETVTSHFADSLITAKSPYPVGGSDLTLANYKYAFIYRYDYTVVDVSFSDFGPVLLKGISDDSIDNPVTPDETKLFSIGSSFSTITNIPVLANSSTNYDTSNIVVEIYRTIDNGETYYLVGSVANGTTSFIDRVTDAELVDNRELYTSGGVVSNDPPPKAKIVHIVDDTAYYANLSIDGVSHPNRIAQSIKQDIDSVPLDFFLDLPNEAIGFSSVKGTKVAWTPTQTFRVEGSFDLLGRGSMTAVAISDATGLSASISPIQTDDGIIFCGKDGFYITDGYQVKKISRDWLSSYLNLISTSAKAALIQGAYDTKYKRVWWGVCASGSENDTAYILDLNHGIKENSVFTTAVNGTDFAPTALAFFNGQVIRGDSRGYVFKHDTTYTSDPKVDTGTDSSLWLKKTVIYNFISAGFDFGTTEFRKWVSAIRAKFKNLGNLSTQIKGINDDGKVTGSCFPIRARSVTGLINERRFFPSGSLRCMNKQIQLTNAEVIITNSDTLGNATVNHSGKTVTIAAGTWPSDLSDHVIMFENDDYTREFTIVSQTTTILTVSDAGGLLPANGSYKWEIKGYPKDEQMQLISMSIPYQLIGQTQHSGEGEKGDNS